MSNIAFMPWWEREKLFTHKDKEAIQKAKNSCSEDIDEDWAETEAGRYEIQSIIMRKYHYDEARAGMI